MSHINFIDSWMRLTRHACIVQDTNRQDASSLINGLPSMDQHESYILQVSFKTKTQLRASSRLALSGGGLWQYRAW